MQLLNTNGSNIAALPAEHTNQPAYKKIREYILENIESKRWKVGEKIASEAELCKLFNVSRMTVNKALSELTHDRILMRIQGAGTYVASPQVISITVAINNITDQIAREGGRHRLKVLQFMPIFADRELAEKLHIKPKTPLYYSLMVHYKNDQPIQLECRYVNANIIPDYAVQDWSKTTPQVYIQSNLPSFIGEYEISVKLANVEICQHLGLDVDRHCLVMTRVTKTSNQEFAVYTRFWQSTAYKLGGTY